MHKYFTIYVLCFYLDVGIREQHLDDLRKQADAVEKKECTFAPQLAARDTYRGPSATRSPSVTRSVVKST